ncbi:MAG: dihydroneopterin aldolase [Myxococcales bacterium]|nr:dihydroneopterin aldolase [Myxococcales bacterium]
MPNLDLIRIENLSVRCVVGIYPRERERAQEVIVDVTLGLDTETAGREGRIAGTVDYHSAAAQVAFILQSARFRLLETAAHALCAHFLVPPAAGERRSPVLRAEVRVTKPGALPRGARASIEVVRMPEQMHYGREEKPFGTVDVLFEQAQVGLYRLNVHPGQGIPLHRHERMFESELVLTDGLLCQGVSVSAGTVHRWPRGAAHHYDNPTDTVQSILCIDCPRFHEEDEIATEGSPDDVAPEPPWDGRSLSS